MVKSFFAEVCLYMYKRLSKSNLPNDASSQDNESELMLNVSESTNEWNKYTLRIAQQQRNPLSKSVSHGN